MAPARPLRISAGTADPRAAGRPPGGAAPVAPAELAVVRLPVADARDVIVGYELLFARAGAPPARAVNARATAAMLDGAFADIGLDRLTGRHPAWLSVAREFLLGVGVPPVRPDRAVLQLRPETADEDLLAVLQRLARAGYTLAVALPAADEAVDPLLLELCSIVKVPIGAPSGAATARRLRASGLQVVATGVDDADDLALAREAGVAMYQGAVLAQPGTVLARGVATAGLAPLRALADLAGGQQSFEDIERIVACDVGLSLKLLRYVNSAFFALPRSIGSVREALALLGSRTVQRWALVVVMADAPDTPQELVALALQRARMCETVGAVIATEDPATLFTVGLFSVADALLGVPMAEVLDELPFADDVRAALLRHEGDKGRLLAAVLAYERGEFPELPAIGAAGTDAAAAGTSLADAYREAIAWADDAAAAVRGG